MNTPSDDEIIMELIRQETSNEVLALWREAVIKRLAELEIEKVLKNEPSAG